MGLVRATSTHTCLLPPASEAAAAPVSGRWASSGNTTAFPGRSLRNYTGAIIVAPTALEVLSATVTSTLMQCATQL